MLLLTMIYDRISNVSVPLGLSCWVVGWLIKENPGINRGDTSMLSWRWNFTIFKGADERDEAKFQRCGHFPTLIQRIFIFFNNELSPSKNSFQINF